MDFVIHHNVSKHLSCVPQSSLTRVMITVLPGICMVLTAPNYNSSSLHFIQSSVRIDFLSPPLFSPIPQKHHQQDHLSHFLKFTPNTFHHGWTLLPVFFWPQVDQSKSVSFSSATFFFTDIWERSRIFGKISADILCVICKHLESLSRDIIK